MSQRVPAVPDDPQLRKTDRGGWLSKVTFLLGIWFLLGGVVHLLGIGVHWAKAGLPDANHMGYLLLIGCVQLATGALQWTASAGMRRGERAAFHSSWIACLLLSGYAATAFIVTPAGKMGLHFLLAAYLVGHLALASVLVRALKTMGHG